MRLLALVAAAVLLAVPCAAAQSGADWDSLGVGELERAAGDYGADIELSGGLTLDGGLAQVAGRAMELLPGALSACLKSALMLMAVALLCAMAQGLRAAGQREGLQTAVMAGALAVTAVAVTDMGTMMGLGRRTIDNMQGFAQALLPAMAAVTAAAGGTAGAAARQIATTLFSNALLTLIDVLLVPLVYAYVAACTAYAAVGSPGLKKVAGVLKWAVTAILSALLLAFVTYLTVSGVIAGNTDAMALKAAKMAISGAVPVVGGIISDAAETVLAGAGVLKNTVGVFGMAAVLCICVAPFLQLAVHYLTYKLTAALASILSGGRLGELIDGIGTAFGLILGMTGACALLLLVSIVAGMAGAAA